MGRIKRAWNVVRRRGRHSQRESFDESVPAAASSEVLREVRLGLVMNGGVSLAVWIGGVTHEIDCLRRAHGASDRDCKAQPTTRQYRELLGILRERVVVDVIAGASAGGINGALLAAAVYAQRALPPLHDVWISVGDFSKLLRSPSKAQPASLLRGDEFVLPELEEQFDDVLARGGDGPVEPLYLYITGTDFYGSRRTFADSTFRRFEELDHRRVFRFQHPPPDPTGETEAEAAAEVEVKAAAEVGDNGARPEGAAVGSRSASNNGARRMPPVATFKLPDAPNLLAQAARSSSSFPVAFEAHGMTFADDEVQRWLIDGGVLDNQPFNPVLNRIATIAGGDLPIRRVLGYIVPYVTEGGSGPAASAPGAACARPTAKETASAASSLPRDLPKLVDLERVASELNESRRFERANESVRALSEHQLNTLAATLFKTYRQTRLYDCAETFAQWATPSFQPGAGEIGQLETLDPDQTLAEDSPRQGVQPGGQRTWIPDKRIWDREAEWHWGLSPSERIARDALLSLRKIVGETSVKTDDAVWQAKLAASDLVAKARALKFLTSERFIARRGQPPLARANGAYAEAVAKLTADFKDLATKLDTAHAADSRAPLLQHLINAEVVQNAFIVNRIAPPAVFDFLHMSAGIRNALGHYDRTPETKLAGMKLNHFAGFLKRSWRANDWMWGRLDATQYLVASVLDRAHLAVLEARRGDVVFGELADLALGDDEDGAVADAWRATVQWARDRDYGQASLAEEVRVALDLDDAEPVRAQFIRLLKAAIATAPAPKPRVAAAVLDCCRAAIAARIQLEILAEELPRIARAVKDDLELGASRASSGADWIRTPIEDTVTGRLDAFRKLRIGKEETPEAEASSKLGMDVASTAAAVGAAAFSGSHGGLPPAIRAPLASLRGITLVFNIIVRLLVRTPAIGIAAVLAAAVAVVWALAQPNTILGAALPGLAAAVIGGVAVLITMATSPLEARGRGIWSGLALLLIVAVPIALLVFVFGLPFGLREHLPLLDSWSFSMGGASKWLAGKTARTAVDIASCLTLLALAAALARLLLGLISRKFRVIVLWIYRWSLLLVGGTLAGGAAYASVHDKSANWSGTILFLILFGAISLAPLIAELAAGGRWTAERLSIRRRRRQKQRAGETAAAE